MNKNRHLSVLIFSLILLVSVFLCSCGIPSFCTLNNISITAKTGSKFGFNIKGTDTDLSLIEEGPGVLLMFVQGDQETPYSDLTNSSGIVSSFKNLSENKVYINSDNSIITYKSGDNNEYTLMAFCNYVDSSFISAKTPSYTLNLKNLGYISSNTVNNASFILNKESWDDDKVIISIIGEEDNLIHTIGAEIDSSTNKYIYIYVALSAEVGDFSNIYWSNLKYIGSISKDSQ